MGKWSKIAALIFAVTAGVILFSPKNAEAATASNCRWFSGAHIQCDLQPDGKPHDFYYDPIYAQGTNGLVFRNPNTNYFLIVGCSDSCPNQNDKGNFDTAHFYNAPNTNTGVADLSNFQSGQQVDVSGGNLNDKNQPIYGIGKDPQACNIHPNGIFENCHNLAENNNWTTASAADITNKIKQSYNPPDQGGQDAECGVQSGAFAWIICPAITLINKVITATLNGVIKPLLVIRPLDSSTEGLHKVWQAFQGLANIAFVLAFIFIIFANTLSININAYTIKKMLPRLVAAAILVQFSYVICSLAVDFGNILGAGIQGIINSVVMAATAHGANAGANVSIGANTDTLVTALGAGIVALFAAGVISVVGVGTILLFAFAGLISVLGTLLTIMIRQLLIGLLIVISPLAFAAAILPNTEGYFRKWLTTYIRLILMYPLIIFIFAMGAVFKLTGFNLNAAGVSTAVSQVVTAAFPIIAFMMIPWTFKWAGGAMSTVAGVVGGRTQGWAKGLRSGGLAQNLRQAQREKNFQRLGTTTPEGTSRLGRVGFGTSRALGRLGTGTFLPTSISKRQRAAGYAAAMEAAGKAHGNQFDQDGYTPDDFKNIVDAKLGSTYKNTKVDAAAKGKALEKMIQYGDFETMHGIKKQVEDGQFDKNIWQYATSRNASDIVQKAPDLLMDNKTAFGNISAEKITNWDHSTLRNMGAYMASTKDLAMTPQAEIDRQAAAIPDKAAREKFVENYQTVKAQHTAAATALVEVASSQARRGRVTAKAVKAIHDIAEQKQLAGGDSEHLAEVYQASGAINWTKPDADEGGGGTPSGGGGAAGGAGTPTAPTGGGSAGGGTSTSAPSAPSSGGTPSASATGTGASSAATANPFEGLTGDPDFYERYATLYASPLSSQADRDRARAELMRADTSGRALGVALSRRKTYAPPAERAQIDDQLRYLPH